MPALMAGNAVILKPSAQTPLAGERIVEALNRPVSRRSAAVPAHDHAGTQALIRAPLVDGVCFTGFGRWRRGCRSRRRRAIHPRRPELGGNDPAYVRADAKLDAAVETLVDGAFYNSGQSCCGIQRIYVQRTNYAGVRRSRGRADAAIRARQPARGGDHARPGGARIGGRCLRARRSPTPWPKGARTLDDVRGLRSTRRGARTSPQILLVDVHHGMTLMNDECFGPVVGIMPVDTDDEAVALMNDSPYGLTACLFTQGRRRRARARRPAADGTVFMNRCDHLDLALAWTGVRTRPAAAATLSAVGYEHLTRPKSFHFKHL